ncbi:hypothetical protein DFQ29_001578 [Apophysomyces sp. BC1021]|nr:hypothetical protein DFQ29_001578 [Apophysomyces sp. BC1021]
MNTTMSLGRIICVCVLVGLNTAQLLRARRIADDNNENENDDVALALGQVQRDIYQQEMANRTGQLALVNFAVAVALSARYSILLRPFGVDKTRIWHMWFARVGSCCTLFHACYQFVRNYARQEHDLWLTLTSNTRYFTGFCMMAATVVLFAGAHPLVRMLSYRLFRYLHITAFGVMVLVSFLHHWTFALFYVAVVGVWFVDQLQQYGVGTRQARLVAMEVLSGKVLKLQVQPSYSHKNTLTPGQFVFLSLKSSRLSSWLHAHPFSVARLDACTDIKTAEDNETDQVNPFATANRSYSPYLEADSRQAVLTFYIKSIGKHTTAWHKLAQTADVSTDIPIVISKPLGRPLLDAAGRGYGDFEQVVLVAEGIGITPWISVLQYMEQQQYHVRTKELVLIWSIRDTEMLHAFADELSRLTKSIHLQYQIDIYLTRLSGIEEGHPSIRHSHIQCGRPDYASLLEDVRSRCSQIDVALGMCAHEETIRTCGNIARSAKYSHGYSQWVIHNEQFQI